MASKLDPLLQVVKFIQYLTDFESYIYSISFLIVISYLILVAEFSVIIYVPTMTILFIFYARYIKLKLNTINRDAQVLENI